MPITIIGMQMKKFSVTKQANASNCWDHIMTLLIVDRGTSKRQLCAERRWHLPLRCDTGTASGVVWIISTRGGLQYCNPKSHEMPDAPLSPTLFWPPHDCHLGWSAPVPLPSPLTAAGHSQTICLQCTCEVGLHAKIYWLHNKNLPET